MLALNYWFFFFRSDFVDENGMPQAYLRFVYKPWTHAYVFFFGYLLGDYLYHNHKNMKRPLRTATKYGLWCLAIASFAFSIYSTTPWLTGRPYTPLISAFLFPLNLLTWTLGMTLSICLCVSGNGGLLGRLLSASFWVPLSRTSYAVYLTHVWIVWIGAGTRRSLIELRGEAVALFLAGQVALSFLLGFLFTVLYETPVIYALEELKRVAFSEKALSKDDTVAGQTDGKVKNAELTLLNIKC